MAKPIPPVGTVCAFCPASAVTYVEGPGPGEFFVSEDGGELEEVSGDFPACFECALDYPGDGWGDGPDDAPPPIAPIGPVEGLAEHGVVGYAVV